MRAFIGTTGDSYDRFLIRSREMFESVNIVSQISCKLLNNLNTIKLNSNFGSNAYGQANSCSKTTMELLIKRFANVDAPTALHACITYGVVEAGKGEFGVLALLNDTRYLYRVHLRSPAYAHLQLISLLGVGHQFADLVVLVGTLDLVFGEVDR